MNKEQYIKKILKYIKVTDKTKERIKFDILSDIESKEESGLTVEDIILQMGTPQKVANEFNHAYSNTAMRKWYSFQKATKIAAIVLLSISMLVFVCSTFGGVFLMQDISISAIGGADGPTNIIVSEQPVSFSPDVFVNGNILGCALLVLGIACVVIYYVIRKKK